MKKLFALILLFITLQSQAQYPVTQYMGSSNVVVKSRGGLGTDSTFTFATSYSDTSALNRGFLKNIPGVMARVGDNLYLRSALADRWILLGSTSGGVNIYNSDGTLTGARIVTGAGNDLTFTGIGNFTTSVSSSAYIGTSSNNRVNITGGLSSSISIKTPSFQLESVPRLGMLGKRVLVKDTLTNQVSEVAIDSLGGGGTQTLQTVTNNGDSTTNKIITGDSLIARTAQVRGFFTVGDTLASGKIWVAFGNSVTVYSGLTEAQGYVALTSSLMGWLNINRGIGGTTMSQYSAGDSSAINRLYLVPTYNSSIYSFISCEYGLNDANLHGTDTATYRASVNRWIDTCVARGWPKGRILILGPTYATKITYLPGRYYALVGVDAANKKGVLSTNMWDSLYSRGGGNSSLIAADSIHPTALGHINMAQVLYNAIYSLTRVGNLTVNGGATIKDTLSALVGIRTLQYSPSTSITFKNFFGGKSIFGNHVYVQQTVDNDNAPLNVGTSVNQVGVSIWEGTSKFTRIYGGRVDVGDVGTSAGTYLSPGVINIAASDLSFIGGTGYEHLFVGRFGGVIVNGQGISNGYLKVKGSLNKGYLLYASPDSNRVGINDSLPQQTLSVQGSEYVKDSVIHAGVEKSTGLGATIPVDSSNNKLLVIDSSGYHHKMNWPTFGTGSSGNNVYIQIDKTWDSTGWARNDSTVKFKSQEIIVRGSRVTAGGTDSTNVYNIMASDSAGTYTPTLTNTTNIAASTAYTTYWRRVGDVVDVWGEVDIDATTAATLSELGMSLPVTTDVVNTYDLAGTAAFEDNTSVKIMGDATNNRAKFRFSPVTNTNNKYSFHFTYKWIAP